MGETGKDGHVEVGGRGVGPVVVVDYRGVVRETAVDVEAAAGRRKKKEKEEGNKKKEKRGKYGKYGKYEEEEYRIEQKVGEGI